MKYTQRPGAERSALAARRAADAGDVAHLLDLLATGDRIGRVAAASRLGELGGAEVVKPLTTCLRSNDFLLRTAAVEALGRIGGPDADERIVELGLDDPSLNVRLAAAAVLARRNRRDVAIRVLVGVVASRSLRPRVAQRAALKALLQLNATEAAPLLEEIGRRSGPLTRFKIWRVRRHLAARPPA